MDQSENLLECCGVSVQYQDRIILDQVSFFVGEGEWLMVIGPNGAGKSTIINCISGEAPYTGRILYRNTDIRSCKPGQLARNIGILSQNHYVGYSFTVREVVSLGRYAYRKGLMGGIDERKEELVDEALAMTGLTDLQHHSVLKLSGGELQRTFMAQLFAQDPSILILDEPTNHLDLIYQKQIFAIISDWLKQKGRAVISVVHDLSLARAYGTRAILLKDGHVITQGCIQDVFGPEPLEKAYSMDVYAWMRRMFGQWTGVPDASRGQHIVKQEEKA